MNKVSLYQLTADFHAQAAILEDLDLPAEVVADTLESLRGDIEAKGVNVAMFARNLSATADAIKAAEKQMKARREAIERRVEQLTAYLKGAMESTGTFKIEHPMLSILIRKNPESVQIEDAAQIPGEFMRVPPQPAPEPDKTAIKNAIQAGAEVPGARLTRSTRLEIKA